MRRSLEARVGWRLWLATALVFAAFLVAVLPAVARTTLEITGTSASPDSAYLYTAQDLYRWAGAYGEEGRAHYVRSRFTFDVVWPLAYGLFLQVSLLLASRATVVVARLPFVFVLTPTLAVLFDFLENASAALVMARYPATTPVVAHAAPVFTFVKWNVLGLAFALAGLGGLAWLVPGLRRAGGG